MVLHHRSKSLTRRKGENNLYWDRAVRLPPTESNGRYKLPTLNVGLVYSSTSRHD